MRWRLRFPKRPAVSRLGRESTVDRVLGKDGNSRSNDHSQHPPAEDLFQLDREVIPDVNEFPAENFHALSSLP